MIELFHGFVDIQIQGIFITSDRETYLALYFMKRERNDPDHYLSFPSIYLTLQRKRPIIGMYQLSAPAFTVNFTGNYRPVYGSGTKTRAISRREVNRTF